MMKYRGILVSGLAMLFLLVFTMGCDNSDPGGTGIPIPVVKKGWQPFASGVGTDLKDIFFFNNSAGWVVGNDGIILSTSDGGTSWPLAPSSLEPKNFESVFFIDENIGWLAGSQMAQNDNGNIFVSKLGGAYPEVQKEVEGPMLSVFFTDENTGWAGGEEGQIFHTEDAGLSWDTFIIDETAGNITDLYFVAEDRGWATTSNGAIYHTSDGSSWTKEVQVFATALVDIQMLDDEQGWACGDNNTILKRTASDMGGFTWEAFTIPFEFSSLPLHGIFFTSEDAGWVIGENGSIYKTVDGAVTWEIEDIVVINELNAIHFTENGKGFVVGNDGIILIYYP